MYTRPLSACALGTAFEPGRELLEWRGHIGDRAANQPQQQPAELFAHGEIGGLLALRRERKRALALEQPERHATGPNHLAARLKCDDSHRKRPAGTELSVGGDLLAERD